VENLGLLMRVAKASYGICSCKLLNRQWASKEAPHIRGMQLGLSDEESAALSRELRIIDNDRYPFSPCIRTLQEIRDKIRPEPKPEPLPRRNA
jgi:hypothetical protein